MDQNSSNIWSSSTGKPFITLCFHSLSENKIHPANVSKIKQPYFQELPYGLRCPRNATRGLQSVVQAFIIKQFLFDNRPRQKSIPLDHLLKPSETEQQNSLWTAIAEILWNIGERQKTIVGLPGDIPHVQHSHTYFADGVTEKMYLFEFLSREELQIFLKRYLYFVRILNKF